MAVKKKATFESNLEKAILEAAYNIVEIMTVPNLKEATEILSIFKRYLKDQQKEILELKEKLEFLEGDNDSKDEYISELENKAGSYHDNANEVLESIGYPTEKYAKTEPASHYDYQQTSGPGVGIYVIGDCPIYLQSDIEKFLETIKTKY